MANNVTSDPTNWIVAIFDTESTATEAKRALIETKIAEEVTLLHGETDADKFDTSAKWFADTDEEMKKFQRALLAGSTIVAVPVRDREAKDHIHAILSGFTTQSTTYFGQWVYEEMR